jgi:hypothetical protein
MKLLKFIAIIIVVCFLGVAGGWYYITNKVALELNTKYAGQTFSLKGIDKQDYFVTFEKIVPAGFPYKIAWSINGWKEESRSAEIDYKSPIKFGYDLLRQKVFVSFEGEILALYKPAKRGFGSLLKIKNYELATDLPLSRGLFQTLKTISDPLQLINHIGDVNISTGKVEIFDLANDEKFYDKQHEHFNLNFVPGKKYTDLEDFLSNIPKRYTINYDIKSNIVNARMRKIPTSLFYGFSSLPVGFNITAKAEINTEGNTIKDFMKGLEIKSNITYNSTYLDFPDFNIYYKSGQYADGRNYQINTDTKMKIKDGFFDQIFDSYITYSAGHVHSPLNKIMDNEIRYIIRQKEDFKFKELENNTYNFTFNVNSQNKNRKKYLKVENFSILSEQSGIKLKHEMESKTGGKDWIAKGILYVNNHPAVIDFTSAYIYRFGKFRILNNEARKLYVDVNKKFFKDISDYPKSESNDLSFVYSINSQNFAKSEFGSIKFEQIAELYSLLFYQILLDKVGYGGDVLGRIRQILPGIDGTEPLLRNILPRVSGNKKIDKVIEKEVNKVIPKETQDIIEKLIPKDKLNKISLKNLIK